MIKSQLSRRAGLKLMGTALGSILVGTKIARVSYAADKEVLVLGVDISDTNSLDPGHQFVYSAPTTMRAAYETLVRTRSSPAATPSRPRTSSSASSASRT
jgi:hypothetical protein